MVFDLDVVDIVDSGAGRSCIALINTFGLDKRHTMTM